MFKLLEIISENLIGAQYSFLEMVCILGITLILSLVIIFCIIAIISELFKRFFKKNEDNQVETIDDDYVGIIDLDAYEDFDIMAPIKDQES